MQVRGEGTINHLHGDADEEEKVEFEKADDNLIPPVHCYRGVVLDRVG